MKDHRLIALSEYTLRETEWLWPDRVPFGGISLVEGDPGSNKSSLLYDISARVSTGTSMPGCETSRPPEAVILLQAEDNPNTMRRNLEAAGADLTKVFAFGRRGSCSAKAICLPENIDVLAGAIKETSAKLIVIDPLTAYAKTGLTNERVVRKFTQPLAALAEDTGAAIVLVRHLTKSGNANPLYRGAGAIGLIAAARAALLVAQDPSDPDQRVLAQTKRSLAAPAPSLLFRPITRAGGLTVEYLGPSEYAAAQLLEAGRSQSSGELQEAVYALYSILGDGPVLAKEAKQIASAAGISERTLRRAKEVLKVASRRSGFGRGSVFFWVLPKEHQPVAELMGRDLDELLEKLCHGESDSPSSENPCDSEGQANGPTNQKPDDDAGPANLPAGE